MKLRHLPLERKAMTNLDSILKNRDITLLTKLFFPVVMCGCESWTVTEGWTLKNWYFWNVVLEKTLESPLDRKKIKPVIPKGNQFWIFIGRTAVEAEAPILWPPDAKSLLIGKDPDAGQDWGQEEKGATEGEMIGWNHWLDGHESEKTPGNSEGQGSLECCSSWGCKELEMS